MFKFGIHMLVWTEHFTEKDLPLIEKAKLLGFEVLQVKLSHLEKFPAALIREEAKRVGVEIVTSGQLNREENIIDSSPVVRKRGVESLRRQVDVANEVGSKLLSGVIYASWGYLTGRPRTEAEWKWSVESMREVAQYAQRTSDLVIAVEAVQRFETHFLNIAADAVKYCRDVGVGNMKVHLDTFHMIREESSFTKAIETCGKEYLAFVHVSENDRGIPGTGLVPWGEIFATLKKIGYTGPLVIESFSPEFQDYNRLCAIWRKFAESGEQLASEGLRNLREMERSMS